MEEKQRLIGVDLFRGIAVYAVIVIHTEHQASIPGSWAAKLVQFSLFAVPFFLATSFYLAINSLHTKKAKFSLKVRLTRILIPYGVWSIIYLSKTAAEYIFKSIILNQPLEGVSIFRDPINIIFFGGAAYHLYFLAILFSGTIFIKFAEYLISKQNKVQVLFLLFGISISIYNLILVSGNSFQLATGTAFQGVLNITLIDGNKNPLVRVILVEISWIIRCIPYIFMAMILNHSVIKKYFINFNTNATIFFCIFFVFNSFGSSFFPEAVYEIGRGYFALLFAISLSFKLKENPVINNISLCSFGIYLIHLLVVHIFQSITKKLFPGSETMAVTLIPLVISSCCSFIVSWMITSLLVKKKSISKLMFGV